MDHPVVVTCVADHLTLGALCRLRRALGRSGIDGCQEIVYMCRARTGLKFIASMQHLCKHMNRTRARCRECGRRTHRQVHVCFDCASQTGGYHELVSRTDVLNRYKGVRPGTLRRICVDIPVATVTATGKFLYWSVDMHRTILLIPGVLVAMPG